MRRARSGIPEAARPRSHRHRARAAARGARRQARPMPKRLRLAYERIVALDPYDAGAHTALGRLAMKKTQTEIAVREFKAAMALQPADRAAAHCDLGEAYLRDRPGRRRETRSAGRARARAHLRARAGTAPQGDPVEARRGTEAMTGRDSRAGDTARRCGWPSALARGRRARAVRGRAGDRRARLALRRPAVDVRAHPLPGVDDAAAAASAARKTSRGSSTRPRRNRTSRAGSAP